MLRKEAALQGLKDLTLFPSLSIPLPAHYFPTSIPLIGFFLFCAAFWLQRQSTSPSPNFTCNPPSPIQLLS